MTTWWHHPTILNLPFNRRLAFRVSCILVLCIALITTLFISTITNAAPGTNQTVGFQGRILDSTGNIVRDGYYNMQFKIYQDGTGTAAGNPGGTLKWTETYVNNGSATGAVEVKNGFMSVNLGSLTPFGTSVDWNQDTLWLSMNIAGSSTSCTTFNTGSCAADGEMLPMKRLTATPYAINSNAVGGKSVSDLVQLGQGVQTDARTTSSIFINKTGTGNLIQLQASGTDAFTVNNAGNVTLGSAANKTIGVAGATSGAGKSLTISAGNAATGSNLGGGDLLLQAGAGNGTGTTGNVIVKANGTNSTGTFQVQNAAGQTALSVNTITNTVSAGTVSIKPITTEVSTDVSLWNNATTPATIDGGETSGAEVGIKFTTSQAGIVKSVKFYKSANNSGTHTGNIWTTSGTNLGFVQFTNETASGWQQATFATPVRVEANTTYIVSYYSPQGHFSTNSNYFAASSYTNGPLTALQNGTNGPNAVFSYSSKSIFPEYDTGSSLNPWVDVVFQADINDRISSTNNLSLTANGTMTVGPTNQTLKLQGSTINVTASTGGNVNIQGGSAESSNTNGGNVVLKGGSGSGSGGDGLVVMTTPSLSTITNDLNCFTNGVTVTYNCVVTSQSVNNSAAVMLGFSVAGLSATLPDPLNKTPGRIYYVTASAGSKDFTFIMNGGGKGNQPTMRANTTIPLLWNGSDWTIASTTNYGVNTINNVETMQIGSGTADGNTTLLTLDKAASAPTITDTALLGSMYYDSTAGKVQCYEADGWGQCSSSPDTFVTMVPEYANAVQNGTATGTMTTDFCSDGLNINDGSSSQATVCGLNETFNYYKWNSTTTTGAQVKSIYVTYQLPSSFKNFIAGSTSLLGRTDSTNAITNYTVHKSNSAGITTCGSAVSTSTGVQTLWQKGTASGTADPANCSFVAGDSIVFKVSLSARNSTNAYASNLNFAFSSK
jgi:hypothetical protein